MYLFHLGNRRKSRARGKIMFEGLNTRFRPFHQSLYRTVRAVTYIADDLMPGGGPLRKKAVAHSLHFAAYYKLPRNFV